MSEFITSGFHNATLNVWSVLIVPDWVMGDHMTPFCHKKVCKNALKYLSIAASSSLIKKKYLTQGVHDTVPPNLTENFLSRFKTPKWAAIASLSQYKINNVVLLTSLVKYKINNSPLLTCSRRRSRLDIVILYTPVTVYRSTPVR